MIEILICFLSSTFLATMIVWLTMEGLLYRTVKANKMIPAKILLKIGVYPEDDFIIKYAVINNNPDMVLLLSKYCDLNYKLNSNRTLLMVASRMGYTDIVKLLLMKYSTNIDCQDDYGWTALMWAALKNHLEVAELLVAYGADVNKRNNTGQTPLMIANSQGHKDMVGFLIKHKADVSMLKSEDAIDFMIV